MNINTALKFLVAFEAVRAGVHAQSVVADRTSDTNVADAALLDVVLENLRVVVDPVTRGDGSSSKTGTIHHTVADAVSDVVLKTLPDAPVPLSSGYGATGDATSGVQVPLSSGYGGTGFATSGVQVPLSSGDGGTGDATMDISGQPALPSDQGSSGGMTQRKIAKGSKKNQLPMYRKALRIKVIVQKAMKLRAMEARVIKIVLHILTGQQDNDNDNDRRGLGSLLSTTPIVTATGSTETKCADPAANGGSMLACYDTTITIDSEENLEGVIPPLTASIWTHEHFEGAEGIPVMDISGQPGSSCGATSDCAVPTGLTHAVCREGSCQSGTSGSSCGATSDCVKPPGLEHPVCREGSHRPYTMSCQSGTSGSSCGVTDDCVKPPGLEHPVCRKGKCQWGTLLDSCGNNSDCVSPLFECVEENCKKATPNTVATKCKNTSDCAIPSGLTHAVCREGSCQSGRSGSSCGVTSDCVQPQQLEHPVCRQGKCQWGNYLDYCGNDSDCASHFHCVGATNIAKCQYCGFLGTEYCDCSDFSCTTILYYSKDNTPK